MRDPDKPFSTSLMLSLGLFIGAAVAPAACVAQSDPAQPDAMQDEQVATPEAAAASPSGAEVYNAVCIACHSPPGVGGAPALGDGDAWAPRIAQGMDTLIDHALHGFSGSTGGIMPRKGGRLDLSDEEIIAAIEFMVEQVGP